MTLTARIRAVLASSPARWWWAREIAAVLDVDPVRVAERCSQAARLGRGVESRCISRFGAQRQYRAVVVVKRQPMSAAGLLAVWA